jgi:hypothetical protein
MRERYMGHFNVGRVANMRRVRDMVRSGGERKASGSFLKKRTKKLL